MRLPSSIRRPAPGGGPHSDRWFRHAAPSRDGKRLFAVNTKNIAGPSDFAVSSTDGAPVVPPDGHNGYVLALEKAGLLSLPVPDARALPAWLSAMVDDNNHFARRRPDAMMASPGYAYSSR